MQSQSMKTNRSSSELSLIQKYVIFQEKIHSLKGENQIIDIRNIGLMGAVQFGPGKLPATEFAANVFQHCYDLSLIHI